VQGIADAVFCDSGGQAVMTLNLNEAALAKGTLGTIISGYCARSGQRSAAIPTERFSTVLTVLGAMVVAGMFLMLLGFLRRSGRPRATPAPTMAQATASQSGVLGPNAPSAAYAERTRQRDVDDARAQRSANTARAAAAAAAVPRPAAAAASVADWQIGMPSSTPAPRPSERFSFDQAAPPILDSDKLIQLNQLQLAYESSLITRSEYDARRDALLRSASAGAGKPS
jgi:hypothetical protein